MQKDQQRELNAVKICVDPRHHQLEASINKAVHQQLGMVGTNLMPAWQETGVTAIRLEGLNQPHQPEIVTDCLIMKYYHEADMEKYAAKVWAKQKVFKAKSIRFILHSICNAMTNLRRLDYAHGDIKPKNIYIDVDQLSRVAEVIVGDLGNAQKINGNPDFCGTEIWSDPDVVANQMPYKQQPADIFSLGMVLLYLWMGPINTFIQFFHQYYRREDFWQIVRQRARQPFQDEEMQQLLMNTVCPANRRWTLQEITRCRFYLNPDRSSASTFVGDLLI